MEPQNRTESVDNNLLQLLFTSAYEEEHKWVENIEKTIGHYIAVLGGLAGIGVLALWKAPSEYNIVVFCGLIVIGIMILVISNFELKHIRRYHKRQMLALLRRKKVEKLLKLDDKKYEVPGLWKNDHLLSEYETKEDNPNNLINASNEWINEKTKNTSMVDIFNGYTGIGVFIGCLFIILGIILFCL